MPNGYEVKHGDLFLVCWDGQLPIQCGPVPHSYFVADNTRRFILPEFPYLRPTSEGFFVSSANNKTLEEMGIGRGEGTWLDFEKHRITFRWNACLIQIPQTADLPPEILEIMEITPTELRTLHPSGSIFAVYLDRPQGSLVMMRLAAYFYLLACSQLARDIIIRGSNLLMSAIYSGPMFPHPYLLATVVGERRGIAMADLFLEFAMSLIKNRQQKESQNSPLPDVKDLKGLANSLFQAEMDFWQSKELEPSAIAQYVAEKIRISDGQPEKLCLSWDKLLPFWELL